MTALSCYCIPNSITSIQFPETNICCKRKQLPDFSKEAISDTQTTQPEKGYCHLFLLEQLLHKLEG